MKVFNDAVPDAIVASVDDPLRVCPVLAGAAFVSGDCLTVRTATREVEVRAPAALLAAVHTLCDGTRSLGEVLGQAPDDRVADLREFLPFLLREGALVDATLLVLHAARYAHQGSPFGQSAPSRVTNQMCRRFVANAAAAPGPLPDGTRVVGEAPLSPFFDRRVSSYTFDDRPLPEAALLQLAWSVAGVVRTCHERVGNVAPKRTIASAGGMHLLQVYLALQRHVGDYAPGIYRVGYPAEKAVHLAPVGSGAQLLARAFVKPWQLQDATGALFLAADARAASMRYRNRALQYLFMEAGAALHNAALTAPQIDVGFATIGGYDEKVVTELCGLGDEAVLGAGIFGPAGSAARLAQSLQAIDLEFNWVSGASDRYPLPFHLASARVRTPEEDRPPTWGRDADPHLAYVKAAAESVEREGFREPRKLLVGRMREIPTAVDPRTVVRYAASQYADAVFPFARFDEGEACCWTEGRDLVSGATVHVLAELVFSHRSLADKGMAVQRPFTQVTSSGCAAGPSSEDATHRALLEVVERDAFMRHWLRQAPGQALEETRIPAALQPRLDAIRATGCRVSIQRLSSPWSTVCLVAAQHDALHFTTMGMAARADLGTALSGALEETEARVYAWLHGHRPAISDPEQVETPEHHFDLYGSAQHYRCADGVLFPAAFAPVDDPPVPIGLDELLARMQARGLHPVAVDITPAAASIDQGRTRLAVVKAIVPGLLPISFGHGREPLGMVERVHPDATFPHPFP